MTVHLNSSPASPADRIRIPISAPQRNSLIRDMRHRNPRCGMIELWHRIRKRGYEHCPESLFRVMRRLEMFPTAGKKKSYIPKPYEQMTYHGERVQIDVKVVPRRCIADPELRLFQYTAIDEYSRLRFMAAYEEQSTYSSADFLRRAYKWFKRRGVDIKCRQAIIVKDNQASCILKLVAADLLSTVLKRKLPELSVVSVRAKASLTDKR